MRISTTSTASHVVLDLHGELSPTDADSPRSRSRPSRSSSVTSATSRRPPARAAGPDHSSRRSLRTRARSLSRRRPRRGRPPATPFRTGGAASRAAMPACPGATASRSSGPSRSAPGCATSRPGARWCGRCWRSMPPSPPVCGSRSGSGSPSLRPCR